MKELTRTAGFLLAAGAFVAAALLVDPGASTPELFSDQGELFYPGFDDPQAPRVIEVVDYDEETATARPLKVEFKAGRWAIPSHFGYPADAEQRLAKTAASVMELRKDAVVSDRVDDHARLGVIDPLDQSATSLSGRGKRVTLRDTGGAVLADFIVGREVEGRPQFRYMRVPGQRRTYSVKTEVEASARFEDWIETDLLKLSAEDVRKVIIHSYSINEEMGVLENVEDLTLSRSGDQWTMSGSRPPRKEKVDALLGALDHLRIVDVQPKPRGLSEDLKTFEGIRLSRESVVSLRQRGFFVTAVGQLFSNEGEILVESASGLLYTLRFGEVAGGGEAAAAGEDPGAADPQGEKAAEDRERGERRYLFITVSHSDARARQYGSGNGNPGSAGKALEKELRNRFADWYYVISGADFAKLRPRRRELLNP